MHLVLSSCPPAWARGTTGAGSLPPAPIHSQSVLGLGLSFHPHARVDLGVVVQRGFGGIAPWAVSVQFLTLSVGKSYDQRAAIPVVQLAADAAVEAAHAIHEYIKSLPIDPFLDERCMLLDDNGDLLFHQPLGTRTPDGKHCLVDGETLPIGESWWRDRQKSVICHGKKLTDCLMHRRPHEHTYRVLHRNWQKDRPLKWRIVGFLLDKDTEHHLLKIARRRIDRMKTTTQELKGEMG